MADAGHPSEIEVAATPDALDGRAKVEARMALCTAEEQAAFWEAVGRCFGGGTAPDRKPADA